MGKFDISKIIREAVESGVAADYKMQFVEVPNDAQVLNMAKYEKDAANVVALSEATALTADLSEGSAYECHRLYIVLGPQTKTDRNVAAVDIFNHLLTALKDAAPQFEAAGLRLPRRVKLCPMPSPRNMGNIWYAFTLELRGEADYGEGEASLWDNAASDSSSEGLPEVEGYEYFMVKK